MWTLDEARNNAIKIMVEGGWNREEAASRVASMANAEVIDFIGDDVDYAVNTI